MDELQELDAEIRAVLVDGRVLECLTGAVDFFGSSDVVLFYDVTIPNEPITALPRAQCLDDQGLPDSVRTKLGKRASDAAFKFGVGNVTFWFVYLNATEQMGVVAVSATLVGGSGNA
jgi:hypothetical protein